MIFKNIFLHLRRSALVFLTIAATGTTASADEANSGGAGDLLVAPTRVVLDGKTKAAEITLSNRASKEATYRISFTHLSMDDNGKYTELNDASASKDSTSADSLLRYSPHQVTLKAGESQTVKVMARPAETTADGEYCSHLLFRAVPEATTGEDVEAKKAVANNQISVRLIPVYGVSIPVIVRKGALDAQVKLNGIKVTDKSLVVTINRTGTKSVYGDVIITEGNTDNVLGQIRGVAVLLPNAKRHVTIPLTHTPQNALTVEYREREEDGGKTLDKLTFKP